MKNITKEELKTILENHKKWLGDVHCGAQANLSWADLSRADLSGANLSMANLSWANLSMANLSRANLSRADLSRANLSRANLSWANLSGVNLSRANLSRANLSRANLSGVNLSRANLSAKTKIEQHALDKYFPICCPSDGAFIGWKKARGKIVKLLIPEDAMRSSAFGRKCRCNKAVVLGIEERDGTDSELNEVCSNHDINFIYVVGKTVSVGNFCKDRKQECAPGIHFFITRQEAVDYN